MTQQAAVRLTPYDETTNSFELDGNTTEDQNSQLMSYKTITETIAKELPVFKDHEAYSADPADDEYNVADIFPKKIPTRQETRYSFALLQEWEGYVVSISNETFTARLMDITSNATIEDEEADFLLSDLDDNDRRKISPGTIFRWVIGYRRSPGGTKDRSSRIVFRNLPAWTTKDIRENLHNAGEWASNINVK